MQIKLVFQIQNYTRIVYFQLKSPANHFEFRLYCYNKIKYSSVKQTLSSIVIKYPCSRRTCTTGGHGGLMAAMSTVWPPEGALEGDFSEHGKHSESSFKIMNY